MSPRLEPASDTESRGVPVRSAGQTAKRNKSLLGEERLITRGYHCGDRTPSWAAAGPSCAGLGSTAPPEGPPTLSALWACWIAARLREQKYFFIVSPN